MVGIRDAKSSFVGRRCISAPAAWRAGVFAWVAALLGLAGGCRTLPPDVAAESMMQASLGMPDAIVFRTEGGPIDESFDKSETLTLTEAMRRAVMSDPSIQAALARVRIALADAQQARLWPNPILNLALRWPESGGSPIIEASLAQDIVAILMAPRRSSAADHRLREATADAVIVALDTAAEVQERYASVQALDELVPRLQRRLEPIDKLVDIANARLQVEGTRGDLTTLQAQRVELNVEIAAAEQEQRDQRLQLARLIGEPSSEATWTLDPWQPAQPIAAPEKAWIAAALQHRPEIQAIAWRLAALGDDLALTRLLTWDGASAGAQGEREGGEWSAGPEISLPLPLFDMGQARAARVTAEQIEVRHDLTRAQRAVVEDVRRALESLTRAQANLRLVRDELIPLQEQRRSQAEVLFRAREDVTSLFLAEQDLRAAEAQAVELEQQAAIALVRLQRAVGGAGVAREVAETRPGNGAGPSTAPDSPAASGNATSTETSKEMR